jgi:DNA polymerase-1
MVGFGVPGESPVICPWSPELAAWIEVHLAGWVAFAAPADQGFLRNAQVELRGRVDDLLLMLHVVDARSWDGRERRESGKPPARSLKVAAKFFLGMDDWTPKPIKRLLPGKDRPLPPAWDDLSAELLGGYNANDIVASVALLEYAEAQFAAHPRFQPLYETLSLPLQCALECAAGAGMPIDELVLRHQVEALPGRLDDLALEVERLTGVTVNFNAPHEIAGVLYNNLGLPVVRRTKKKGAPSADKHALAELRGRHPVVEVFEQASASAGQRKTYAGWIPHVRAGRIHPTFHVAGTVTGRVTTSRPTMQNIAHGSARTLFRAPAGFMILQADFSAFEFGIAAWLYQEANMLQAYLTGDPHTLTASDLLGRPPQAGTDERIAWGKAPNLQLLYGQGPSGFYRSGREKWGLTWTLSKATEVHTYWHRRYADVRPAQARIAAQQRAQGYLLSPSGRIRRWARIDDEAERAGANFVVQSSAAELNHAAAILAARSPELAALGAQLVLTVHDSVMFVLPEDAVTPAARLLRPIMADGARAYCAEHLGFAVPFSLAVELKAGASWGEVQPVDLGEED